MRLSDFQVLTFDCYGTLIDWESGLWTALKPMAARAGLSREAALAAFAAAESRQQRATPALRYKLLLDSVQRSLAGEWGVPPLGDGELGASMAEWPAFADTTEALRRLRRHYKLVILSNVDHAGFAHSQPKLGVTFDAVLTAQDIGSYKPDPANFHFLTERLAEMGFARRHILHTAQSLFHDHAPANAARLASCWIDRRGGAMGWGATAPPPEGVRWDFRFPSLAAMAAARDVEA